MNSHAVVTVAAVGFMLAGLFFEVLAPDVVVFAALVVLLLTGVLTPKEALAGFSNEAMFAVAILFVVAYAAQSTGVLDALSGRMMGRSRGGRWAVARIIAPIVALSAFLNNTPIVAMFAPTVRDWALRNRLPPSKFLIPVSYAAIFGGLCTLIGTSTNLVVNGLLLQAGHRGFGMFELTAVGVPCALAGILYMVFVGYRLLPGGADLTEEFRERGREYLVEMVVQEESPLAGRTVEEAGLRHLDRLFLAEIVRAGRPLGPVKPSDRLLAGDHLLFAGPAEGVVALQKFAGLTPGHERHFCTDVVRSGAGRVLEAVVSRSSPMLGRTIREGNFRARYDAAVLAVHRHGETLRTPLGTLELRPGDTLLLLAGEDFLARWSQARDFYLISKVAEVQAVNRRRTALVGACLLGMVGLAAFEVMSILNAAALAALVLLFARSITVVEARRSIELNVLIVIASAFGISRALEKTGVAGAAASMLVEGLRGAGPLGLLAGVYLATAVLTELVTNNAAAALVFPIAMSTAAQAGLAPMPFAVAVAVGASASFSTPIGYQTNLMVYGPGGYRFADFLRVGLPLAAIYAVVTLTVIPLVWSLS